MPDQALFSARTALLNYALQALGVPLLPNSAAFDLSPYLDLLPDGDARGELAAILTTLTPDGSSSHTSAALVPQPLDLRREVIMPGSGQTGDWLTEFGSDWQIVANDPVTRFATSVEILRKYAWAIPGTRGEPDVPLYEEFKLLSALVHASGCSSTPANQFTLVAGDLPGIQRVIYTIASQGAAKGLRGRSFFLQLLSDAVVRLLLADLGLPMTNVVYAAGGNFVLLAGTGIDEQVQYRLDEINTRLLDFFSGNLWVCSARQTVDAHELHGEAFSTHYRMLKQSLVQAKQMPLLHHVTTDWEQLFAPLEEEDLWQIEATEVLEADRDDLRAFNDLAQDLADYTEYLSVGSEIDRQPRSWQQVLYDVTGLWYGLHDSQSTPTSSPNTHIYRLNSTDFALSGADGFRFVATRTPRMTSDDVTWLRTRHPDEPEQWGYEGTVRMFECLAEASEGVRQLGILRMDVDNLGRIFGQYIQPASLTRISSASMAVSLFFDGWLNVICEELEVDHPNTLYVIYAGGDDLFVVGPWALMPQLAQRIRDDFSQYTNNNPHITISAGISIGGAHYPLYRAAEQARQALDDGAKGAWYGLNGEIRRKNAISLLGQVVGWEDGWPVVTGACERMLYLLEQGMPKALHQTIRRIYAQYHEKRRRAQQAGRLQKGELHFGRWMWMQAYSLSRLSQRYTSQISDAPQQVQALQEALLSPSTIHLAGLAARWMDYLQRDQSGE